MKRKHATAFGRFKKSLNHKFYEMIPERITRLLRTIYELEKKVKTLEDFIMISIPNPELR